MPDALPTDDRATPVIAQFHGIHVTPALIDPLKAGKPDGVLLRRRNIETPEQVRQLCTTLKRELGEHLLIAVRHEGGVETPFVRGVTAFPGLEALEAAANPVLARDVGRAMGAELAALGIGMNLVPTDGPMAAELCVGLRCSGIKVGDGATVPPAPRSAEDGDHALLASVVAEAALRVVRDPGKLLPVPPGTRAGLLIPRLGEVAHRLPIEESLRMTAGLIRPQVGASVAVLEIGVEPDANAAELALEWMAGQDLAVVFAFELARHPAAFA